MSSVPSAPLHDVARGLAQIADGVNTVLGARTWSMTADEVHGALAEAARLENALAAAKLSLVRASVARDGGEVPGRETQQWLQANLRLSPSRARGDVENAALVDPEDGTLRTLGRAFAAGDVSCEHVDVARRALTAIPTHLVATHRGKIDGILTRNATAFTARDMAVPARHLVSVLAPEPKDRLDPDAAERRAGVCFTDSTGMTRISAQLDGEAGATFKAVLDHLATPGKGPDPDDPQQTLPGTSDNRTVAQRGADALAAMARLAASSLEAGTRAGEPPHLVVHATIDQLAWIPTAADSISPAPGLASCEQTGPISPALLQRLACDAVMQVVVLDKAGSIVEMRSPSRFANRAQRRALAARDGGCAWPGCSIPPSWCDAHHVLWWTRGGATVIENLVLLCPRHHTEAHQEEWVIVMRDGAPEFIPPKWVDPEQRPVDNHLHHAVREATALAQQIRLDLPEIRPDPDFPAP